MKGLDFAHFDMTKSGAVLTWEYFHDKSVPKLLLHIQDRDIWKWSIPGSDEILTALDCYPQEFEIWDDLMYKLPRLKDEPNRPNQ